MKRRVALAGAALSALLLGGCVNVDANVDVAADNAISGTATVEISHEAATLMGIDSAAALRKQLSSAESVPAGMTVTVAENGDNLVINLAGQLKETGGMLKATRKGDIQTFTVTNNQAQTEPDPIDNSGTPEPTAGSSDNLTVTARFGGTVTGIEGGQAKRISANTVKFTGPIGEVWSSSATIDLGQPVATSGTGQGSTGALGWLAGAGVLALVVLLIATYIRQRRRAAA